TIVTFSAGAGMRPRSRQRIVEPGRDRMAAMDVRERFERDGFVFPIRVFSTEQAAAYTAAYERHERAGEIKDDSPGLKIHCVFRWAYEIATNPAVLDVVEA